MESNAMQRWVHSGQRYNVMSQYNATKRNTTQYIESNTMQCYTTQRMDWVHSGQRYIVILNTTQRNAIQCNVMQRIGIQYNAPQYNATYGLGAQWAARRSVK